MGCVFLAGYRGKKTNSFRGFPPMASSKCGKPGNGTLDSSAPFQTVRSKQSTHHKGPTTPVPLGKSSAPFIHSSELRHSRSLDFPQTQAAFLFFWVQYAAVELKHGGNCNLPPYCTAFSGSLRIWEGWNHLLIPRLVPY